MSRLALKHVWAYALKFHERIVLFGKSRATKTSSYLVLKISSKRGKSYQNTLHSDHLT